MTLNRWESENSKSRGLMQSETENSVFVPGAESIYLAVVWVVGKKLL